VTADSALTTDHAPASRPWTLTAGAAMAMLLGAVIVAYGVYLPVDGITSHSGLGLTALGGLIVLLMGLLPIAAGRALLRLRRWGRSPAVLMDTLCLAVGYLGFSSTGVEGLLEVLIGVYGLVGIVLLLHPRTTAALWPSGGKE
jgi:hypothetical protein